MLANTVLSSPDSWLSPTVFEHKKGIKLPLGIFHQYCVIFNWCFIMHDLELEQKAVKNRSHKVGKTMD